MSSATTPIKFGPFTVTDQVFYKTPLSYCLVNHKPLQPGHVLIIPFRPVPRLTDLTPSETTDLFLTTQKVQRMLSAIYFSPSSPHCTLPSPLPSDLSPDPLDNGAFNVAIQDGVHAGQTVPHVHVHVIPRARGNELGDKIYGMLQGEEGNVGGVLWDVLKRPGVGKPMETVDDESRKVRDDEVMNVEARMFERGMRELDEEESDRKGKGSMV